MTLELERRVQRAKNQAAIEWLRQQREAAERELAAMSEDEKRAAEAEWRNVMRSIDENRTSARKLFPEVSA